MKNKKNKLKYSFVVTVHDKEWLIERVIDAIVKFTSSPFELIMVYDGCKDNSEKVVNKALLKNKGKMKKLRVVHTPDVFETKANNAGMKKAVGKYIIMFQDDHVVNEISWEKRLTYPMEVYKNVFAVSAMLAHDNIKAKEGSECVLKTINLWNNLYNKYLPNNIFAIRDGCERGPLAFKASMIKKLNYLDEVYAPYIWDSTDSCYKAYKKYGWICGTYKINLISKESWGTTRKKGYTAANLWRETWKRNAKILYSKHKKLINAPKHSENRKLNYPGDKPSFFSVLIRPLLSLIVRVTFKPLNLSKRALRKIKRIVLG